MIRTRLQGFVILSVALELATAGAAWWCVSELKPLAAAARAVDRGGSRGDAQGVASSHARDVAHENAHEDARGDAQGQASRDAMRAVELARRSQRALQAEQTLFFVNVGSVALLGVLGASLCCHVAASLARFARWSSAGVGTSAHASLNVGDELDGAAQALQQFQLAAALAATTGRDGSRTGGGSGRADQALAAALTFRPSRTPR